MKFLLKSKAVFRNTAEVFQTIILLLAFFFFKKKHSPSAYLNYLNYLSFLNFNVK